MPSQLDQMVRVFLQMTTTMMITTQEAALYPIQELGGIAHVMALISMRSRSSRIIVGRMGSSRSVEFSGLPLPLSMNASPSSVILTGHRIAPSWTHIFARR